MTDTYADLFVIGAGSGGVRAARVAAAHGASVMIAEEDRIGGTCVIRGCVPKKLLVYASRFADEFEDAKGYGWDVPKPSFDWRALIENKDHETTRLETAYGNTLDRHKVRTIKSRAVLAGGNHVRLLATGEVVQAKKILIAVGGTPQVPSAVKGSEHAISSDGALTLKALPASILIHGGGYIAVEFAGIFAALGSDVTLVCRSDNVLRGFDEDLRTHLRNEMVRRGITIICGEKVVSIEKSGDDHFVTLSDGRIKSVRQVMFATGRKPYTADLGLQRAGVSLASSGGISVDLYSKTTSEHIYAVGDVTNRINLTPVAIREGHAFADTVFGGKPTVVDYKAIPTAVFSHPEIGTVGLTEAEAAASFDVVDVYKANFRPMKTVVAGRDERTLYKLVVDGVTGRVLGCHIAGPDAGELIQVVAIAIKMGATKSDFDAVMAVHPTAAEELVTMREKAITHTRRNTTEKTA